MSYGLPLVCPSCSRGTAAEKRYYGVLKEARFPTKDIKAGRKDQCPNCRTQLTATR